MSGAELPAIIAAVGTAAGGAASVASASKGQQPGMLSPSAGPQIPGADFNMQQFAAPQRIQQSQSFIPAAPQMSVPSVGDYDRNLLSILQSLGGGR